MGGSLRVDSARVVTLLFHRSTRLSVIALLALPACRPRAETRTEDPWAEALPTDAATVTHDGGVAVRGMLPGELLPGSVRAFGLVMPIGTNEVITSENQRMFYVQAPMPAVMRYLQHRIDIINAEIHPLGAMIHDVHVHTAGPGENFTLDVGVRDEGDRTLVTLWNRSQLPVPPRTEDEGFRAAGFDPRTRRPIGANNF